VTLLKRPQPMASEHESSPMEMRSSPRVAASLSAEITLAGQPGAISCRLRDVGTGGVCLQTPSPFALSSLRTVTLHLPGGTLRVEAEGCWQREATLERAVMTGVRFVRLEHDASARIRKFVEQAAQELTQFLQNRTDLEDLRLDEALDLALASRLREAPTGTLICREGQSRPGDDSLFIVVRGSVTLAATGTRENEIEVERVVQGGLFGGLPLVTDLPPPVSAMVENDVTLLELDRSAFRYLERAKPLVAHRLARSIVVQQVAQFRTIVQRLVDQVHHRR